MSRAPSRSLPDGRAASAEGLVLLGGASFHYDQVQGTQPLFQRGGSHALQRGGHVWHAVLHAALACSSQAFDATAFVVLGPQLTGAMLPHNLTQLQQMQALFCVFALSQVLWLAGSFLWPAVSSKAALLWRLGLAAFSTALVACMPAYTEVSRSVQ
jgi:hypothetical protein